VIVALDATPLILTSGGLARYVAELARALARGYPDDTYVLLSDQKFALPDDSPANLVGGPAETGDKRWWLRGVRRAIEETGAQIFHGTNFEVPYVGSTPAILTIHDLSPWRDPAWHSGADRVRMRTPWLIRLKRARMILTVSEAIRQEIIGHFGVPEERVRAIPLAASEVFRPCFGATTAADAGRKKPYFLFVGTLEPRKNLPALVEAWRTASAQTGADLVIAGRIRADFVPIAPMDSVQLAGEVSDGELARLLSGALASVYPTFYEGFGLPVLEAMQCGCPVITSRDPAVTDTAGGAAIHAESVGEIAAAMVALAASPERREELREKGLARAAQFSWERTAKATRELYEEVVTGAGVRG
jgi:glycosyltransferase involved in cell wall biosynthesis